ncbi:hypothetical protein JW926_11460 [Candidatus Sumerlaeota bacterium]|nr:hypothetical protein [Candidatus Sumerlaeota bacterium]
MRKELDRRWIFLTVGLVVLAFLKIPFAVKYAPNEKTRGVYNAVESLEPGSIVYLSIDYGPSSQAELLPMHEALVYHVLKRNLKIIAGSVWETGPPMTDKAFKSVAARLQEEGISKKYGVDYVNLGYKSGNDVAIAKIGTSIPEAYPRDYLNKPLQEYAIMKGVTNFDQIGLLCNISAGAPGARQWLQQVQTRYNVRMIAGVTAVMAPDLYSFFQSKQVEGFLGGLVGAAEYEYLLQRPGFGMAGMNVQSITHYLILLFILIGNILYLRERARKKREQEA